MTSLPLPSNPYSPGEIFDAYETCRWMESKECHAIESTLDQPLPGFMEKYGPVFLGRFLGYLVLHCPNSDGQQNISRDINECNRESLKLGTVAYIYLTSLIMTFRNPKGSTPTPFSSDYLTFRADDPIEPTKEQLLKPGSSKAAKEVALRRDNYRCCITGVVDSQSRFDQKTSRSNSEMSAATQLAYIVSQSTSEGMSDNLDSSERKLQWASHASAVLEKFGGVSFVSELDEKDVHRPENTFIISSGIHCQSSVSFDRLGIALEQGENPEHTYNVIVYPDHLREEHGIKEKITFQNHVLSESIPIPDPRYLALHAACARVVHLSGAAEVIDKFLKDYEEMPVLAKDGSSAETLFYALDIMSTRPRYLSGQLVDTVP